MPNQYVLQRLAGIQTILRGVHQGSVGLSAATIGREREAFIDEFLSKVLPPIYRFVRAMPPTRTGSKADNSMLL
jgi:hypothetical protein